MIKLSREDIKNHVEDKIGTQITHQVQYADEYLISGHPFYIKPTQLRPLVIPPDWQAELKRNPIDGVYPGAKYYHSSALRKFKKLDGPDREPYGVAVDVRDIPALDALLARIGAIPRAVVAPTSKPAPTIEPQPSSSPVPTTAAASIPQSDVLADIEAASPSLATLPPTQRDALIAARVGQGRFRDGLLQAWNSECAVTGNAVEALLRASHIKPWRDSSNRERLDQENGLLLMANLDAAFDVGLISFGDDGMMLFSPELGPAPEELLGILPGARLRRTPSSTRQSYLQHHRRELWHC